MIRRLALACLAFAGPAAAQDALPGLSATYVCDGGAVLQVAYINPETGPSVAVVAWAGKLVPMQAGPTGSGVRFIAFDEQENWRWRTTGDEGALLFLAADHTAKEEEVLTGCRRVRG